MLSHFYITCTALHFTFYIHIISPSTCTFTNANNPEDRERYHTWYFES